MSTVGNYLHFKTSVDLRSIQPQLLLALLAIERAATAEPTITSCTDDAPGRLPASLHRKGLAVDVRISDQGDPQLFADRIRARLNPQFDVVLELSKEHIHVEFDPK